MPSLATTPVPESKEKFTITTDPIGKFIVNGQRNILAVNLNYLRLFLMYLYCKCQIEKPAEEAAKTIIEAQIKASDSSIIIVEIHPELRAKFPKEKVWSIPLATPLAERFIDEKMLILNRRMTK